MSLPTHVVIKKVCFLPSQLIVQICVLWLCVERLQRKLGGWKQKLVNTVKTRHFVRKVSTDSR